MINDVPIKKGGGEGGEEGEGGGRRFTQRERRISKHNSRKIELMKSP